MASKAGGWALLALRIALGWVYFYGGISKLLEPGWTAAGYLNSLDGTFATFFSAMAGSPAADLLVKWGLLLIGLAILLGALTRFAAFWGIIITTLFYLSGFPPEHGLVEEHIIYMAVLAVLAIVRTPLSLDHASFMQKLSQKAGWLRWLMA